MQVPQYGAQNQKATGWPTYADPKSVAGPSTTDAVDSAIAGDVGADEASGPQAAKRPTTNTAAVTWPKRRRFFM